MDLFEFHYSSIVEPLYGQKRNYIQDQSFSIYDNIYSVSSHDRIDMTSVEVYSIDPDGCEDADDAFSIYYDNGYYLAIHIADPTEYICPHSLLWNDVVQRTTTKYPSNRNPIHLLPHSIVEKASLLTIEKEETKNAITILTKLNDQYEPEGKINLLFTTILVKSENALRYHDPLNETTQIGRKISQALFKIRSKQTIGTKLNEINVSYVKYPLQLYQDSPQEKEMKQMIAEFAIFANSFVGEYLKIHLQKGIFRTCQAKEWLQTIHQSISGEDMLQEIITNGIQANYISEIGAHDLVGKPEYCHFTSPIRRMADCVCHYLLKYIYLQEVPFPFTEDELDFLSNRCLQVTKSDKKIQYKDVKFRLLQVMNEIIKEKNKVLIEFYITGYSGLFLNCIICKIDDFHVHFSYSLRIFHYNKEIQAKEKHLVVVKSVNCFTQFDENTIPELDTYLKS